ncbi:putative 2-hydroxyacid dehydrogenase oxidoreductase protein [Oceanicola granulosus HTCC2516]|uniref:Putative 2-hydroxyacid dehydrogenase oxidoreductase protein n=1 Tax=Oceanicola granulosus (strain ATCC BAA-861 / DSM 15982 / KCTC 12143 / HTCC2516) TaxID=314256 RepID=Q2CJD2_OCEGH|nr:glyoxylate/hydroxypyruvate reductase A [Oceanicola granulosus]EAR52668.1 putative 2-hydroxyacid dehydrogenase oxidoreductase protein [Oceanicola granulosus HTCC2516]
MTEEIRICIASRGKPEELAESFRSELPGAQVFTDPAALDETPVPYVVAGKPAPGVIASVPGAELILSLNAGVEHLLAPGEVPEGVDIVRLVDPAMTEGMSDWCLAVVLSWHRNLPLYRADKGWNRRTEILSRNRVVTVLGAGALGSRVARLLAQIGFQTRVWSRTGRAVEGAEAFAGPDGLDAATRGADAVVNLLPLTDETRDVLDAALFARMAPGGFVASAGRGEHLVDADLLAALDSGQLSGAALDVFRTEPLPEDDPLRAHPNVLVTPHVAAPTQAGSAVRIMADTIRRHRAGAPIPDLVDRRRGY